MKNLFLNTLFIIMINSCGNSQDFKQSPSPLNFDDGQNLEGESSITFDQVRVEVFERSCTQCHSSYDQYDVVNSQLQSITSSIRSFRMPKNSQLSQDQLNLFNQWVLAGAPGPSLNTPPAPTLELEATYESINTHILAKKCTVCHSPQGQVPFLDLSTRFAIFEQRDYLLDFDKPDQSYILEVIQDPFEPMPPKDSPFEQLTDKEIKILQKWIGLGLP